MLGFADSFDLYVRSGSPLAYLAAFAGGVLVSFTPCVYPVLPITVGYVGGHSGGNRARGLLLSVGYAVGMASTYAALGTGAALSGKVFGVSAASPAANLLVGNVCILMALSLFDVFHLPTPFARSGVRPERGRAGLQGALAAGAMSGLVVGPCTAPVLGALLVYVGTRRNVLFGASLLFVFALGIGALPVLAGTFTGLLGNLPRSGKWLGAVRRGFGILLILAGEYFLIEAGKALV